MTPDQINVIVGALVALIAAFTTAFITIYGALKHNTEITKDVAGQTTANAQALGNIHVLVNGNLDQARKDLSAAVSYITKLTETLKAAGAQPPPAPELATPLVPQLPQ